MTEVAQFYNCTILWLPPYSPDKNPMEHRWSNIIKYIHDTIKSFAALQSALNAYFKV
ncbi:MAG: transposase [Christensenellaceae bacterium]|nr:transposase [Christensenellaceae bacterium]